MPMKQDPEKGGANADGSKSLIYCSYCYANGNFTQPDFTVEDMRIFCKSKMKEMGFPGFLAGIFTSGIPSLKDGKKSNVTFNFRVPLEENKTAFSI